MLLAMEKMGVECREFYRGVGCKHCRQTGFSGRIAIHELLVIDEPLRALMTTSPSLNAVRNHAQESGMFPLRYDGLLKVREGMTTLEEVFRVSDEGWAPNLAKKTGLPELLKRTKTDVSADAAGSA